MVPGVTGEMTTGEYHPREVRGESTAPQIMRGIAEPARRLRQVRQSAVPSPPPALPGVCGGRLSLRLGLSPIGDIGPAVCLPWETFGGEQR